MNKQEEPNLNPDLKIYGETGRFSRKTEEETNKDIEEIKKNRDKKIIEAAKENKTDPEAKLEETKEKKPTFDEFKATEQAKQDQDVKKARKGLEEKYDVDIAA